MAFRTYAQDRPPVTRTIPARLRGIYAIASADAGDPLTVCRAALEGGVRIVQYRAKGGIDPNVAAAMRGATRRAGALWLLNDRWQDVERYDADGAHVGPEDAAPQEIAAIRAALTGKILGISCGTPGEARAAAAAGADYVGAGCLFATNSKADAGEPIGLTGLRAIVESTPLPVAAIGGITRSQIQAVRQAGATMAAVISAIAGAADPRAAARELVQAWNAVR